jgi:hypothetical protein
MKAENLLMAEDKEEEDPWSRLHGFPVVATVHYYSVARGITCKLQVNVNSMEGFLNVRRHNSRLQNSGSFAKIANTYLKRSGL